MDLELGYTKLKAEIGILRKHDKWQKNTIDRMTDWGRMMQAKEGKGGLTEAEDNEKTCATLDATIGQTRGKHKSGSHVPRDTPASAGGALVCRDPERQKAR